MQFELGGVFAVPTEAVFVAMWFLLPARMLPVAVCFAMLLAQVPELVRDRPPVDRLALLPASSWFSIGPALVIALTADGKPHWHLLPFYGLALVAQLIFDFVSGRARRRDNPARRAHRVCV